MQLSTRQSGCGRGGEVAELAVQCLSVQPGFGLCNRGSCCYDYEVWFYVRRWLCAQYEKLDVLVGCVELLAGDWKR